MRQLRVSFSISLYPPMESQIEGVKNFLDQKGVVYWSSPPMKEFTMKQNLKGESAPEDMFFYCLQAHCRNLYEGKLGACFLPFVTKYFNEAFGKNLPDDGALLFNLVFTIQIYLA